MLGESLGLAGGGGGGDDGVANDPRGRTDPVTGRVNGHDDGTRDAERLVDDADDVDEEPDPELLITRQESYTD